MAWKVPGICPDAVLYIRLGKALEAGQFDLFLAGIRFNIYPFILSGLHHTGMGWETAGIVWGVVISSCTVLPLYGWVRRAFDERTALGAGFLYAIHPGLVRASIEIIRDSTFWFLLAASIYLLWRAMTELRWRWFIIAGTTISLACLTRVEGLTLFPLLAAWLLWRARNVSGWTSESVAPRPGGLIGPSCRSALVRLALGALVCASLYPLGLLAINRLWYHGNVTALVRTQPADLARDWARSTMTGKQETANLGRTDLAPPLPAWKMAERYATDLFKGFSAIYLLLLGCGIGAARTIIRRPEYLALACVACPILLAIWIHLYWSHEAGPRYFFPVVILTLPLASAGLWRVMLEISVLGASPGITAARSLIGGGVLDRPRLEFLSRRPTLRKVALLAVIVVLQMFVAFSGDTRGRAAAREVGQWVRQRYGPDARIFGPDGLTQVAAHYALARSDSYPDYAETDAVVRRLNGFRPTVVLLATDGRSPRAEIAAQIGELGFAAIDDGLPGVRQWIQVMARRTNAPACDAIGRLATGRKLEDCKLKIEN
jgi:hypothetical protein